MPRIYVDPVRIADTRQYALDAGMPRAEWDRIHGLVGWGRLYLLPGPNAYSYVLYDLATGDVISEHTPKEGDAAGGRQDGLRCCLSDLSIV